MYANFQQYSTCFSRRACDLAYTNAPMVSFHWLIAFPSIMDVEKLPLPYLRYSTNFATFKYFQRSLLEVHVTSRATSTDSWRNANNPRNLAPYIHYPDNLAIIPGHMKLTVCNLGTHLSTTDSI